MAISTLNDIKKGKVFSIDNQPWLVIEANFVRMQQRKPVMQTKLRNLINGKVLEINYHPADKIEEADMLHQKATFLYADVNNANFMNSQTFDQISLGLAELGDQTKYLTEGAEVEVLYYNDNPVSVSIPNKVELKVVQTVSGSRGDTAQGKVTKPATLETGLEIGVPLFINEGDTVRVNTETGDYVERVNG